MEKVSFTKIVAFIILCIWIFFYFLAHHELSQYLKLFPFDIDEKGRSAVFWLKNFQFLSLVLWSSISIIYGVYLIKLKGLSIIPCFLLVFGLLFCVYWFSLNFYMQNQLDEILVSIAEGDTKLRELKENRIKNRSKHSLKKNAEMDLIVAQLWFRTWGEPLEITDENGKTLKFTPSDEDVEIFKGHKDAVGELNKLKQNQILSVWVWGLAIIVSVLIGLYAHTQKCNSIETPC